MSLMHETQVLQRLWRRFNEWDLKTGGLGYGLLFGGFALFMVEAFCLYLRYLP